MKKYNLVARLKATNIAEGKREFKRIVLYISEKYRGKEMFPEKMAWARDTVSRIKDWSFLEA
ncbi:hypothetical protein SAMN05518672_104707 [Chitinophaga sp. CF118]|uniref:hypothetical protein n=1 Tax=Chitinophaga sp. CF118 TaxID=1884367 RepID=UPI0008E12691|nr:hypothetical protein [Chitinophaga sp. CF118]SFE16015.1 hypothetical protein SAMN05518672_104707 [Chitinophaga sp. CF118]